MNPVDDHKGYVSPLIKMLRTWVDRLAESLGSRHDPECVRVAGTWVYLSAVVAWAEDHQLVDVRLRKGLDGRTGLARIGEAFAGLTVHPATQWLMHPRYNAALHTGTPSEEACRELVEWWAADDTASLAYDVEDGPASITGWIIGDILQGITDERRKGNALCQTPWWVADFILDLTLVPACQEFHEERLIRSIDPCCGTGHFLIRQMDYLWEWYTTGELRPRQAATGATATGGVVLSPEDALPRLIASVDGIEMDPLTAAIARLRCTVYAAYLRTGRPVRLDRIPRGMVPRVGVADSLLLGKITRSDYAHVQPALADLPAASFGLTDWEGWLPEPEQADDGSAA